MATVGEEKFDRFADDYFKFLALRYGLDTNCCRIKVVGGNRGNWNTLIPLKLQRATESNPQFQHPYITFHSSSGAGACTTEDKRLGLTAAGFTKEQAESLSNYDALIFMNLDRPVRMRSGEPYIWNILISHQVLHIVETLIDKRLIDEPPDTHYYEAPPVLEHLNRFVAWVTIDDFITRYVPTKD
jgi:hypothetical protein